jgi:hypothetical protein
MINLIHMISILNSVLLLYSTRRDEQNNISFTYVLKNFYINIIYFMFEYVYIYNDQDLCARELMSCDYSLGRKNILKFILLFYNHISVR